MDNVAIVGTPLGALRVEGDDDAVSAIRFVDRGAPPPSTGTGAVARAVAQLQAYFRGELRAFDVPIAPRGTEFQVQVWSALVDIPFGVVCSYAQLAARLGRPGATRAVGAANGSNPIPILVPCHRVVGSDGSLTGYGGGLERKKALLELEGVRTGSNPRGPVPGQLSLF